MLSQQQAIRAKMHRTILLLVLHMLSLLGLLLSLMLGHISPIMEALLIYLLLVSQLKVLGSEEKLCVASFEYSYQLQLKLLSHTKPDLEHPRCVDFPILQSNNEHNQWIIHRQAAL